VSVRVRHVMEPDHPEGPAKPVDKPKWAHREIDRCMADIVKGLQAAQVWTVSSCCGHGKDIGAITLADGRTLYVTSIPAEDAGAFLRMARRRWWHHWRFRWRMRLGRLFFDWGGRRAARRERRRKVREG